MAGLAQIGRGEAGLRGAENLPDRWISPLEGSWKDPSPASRGPLPKKRLRLRLRLEIGNPARSFSDVSEPKKVCQLMVLPGGRSPSTASRRGSLSGPVAASSIP